MFLDAGAMREWASRVLRAVMRQSGAAAAAGGAEPVGVAQWRGTHVQGAQLPFRGGARLSSYLDRAPFFEALAAGACAHALCPHWAAGRPLSRPCCR